jgi:hypothetical protein
MVPAFSAFLYSHTHDTTWEQGVTLPLNCKKGAVCDWRERVMVVTEYVGSYRNAPAPTGPPTTWGLKLLVYEALSY